MNNAWYKFNTHFFHKKTINNENKALTISSQQKQFSSHKIDLFFHSNPTEKREPFKVNSTHYNGHSVTHNFANSHKNRMRKAITIMHFRVHRCAFTILHRIKNAQKCFPLNRRCCISYIQSLAFEIGSNGKENSNVKLRMYPAKISKKKIHQLNTKWNFS